MNDRIKASMRHAKINIKTFVFRMREKLKQPEIWLYLLFGLLTTAVDWTVCFVLYRVFREQIDTIPVFIHLINAAAWAAAVAFAFVTNRRFVFRSERKGGKILAELAGFAGGRILTLLLQEAFFAVFFNWLGLNEYAVKAVSAVIIVILNYVIGRIVFKGGRRGRRSCEGKTQNEEQ